MNDLIDNTLHSIFIASFNYQSAEEGRTKHSISDDLNWYIWTGRATTAWIKALAKADPHKLLESWKDLFIRMRYISTAHIPLKKQQNRL